MALRQRSSGCRATREPRGKRPGRPEVVPRNATYPLRWRFSRLGADWLPACRSRGFGALRPTRVTSCGCRSRAVRRVTLERRCGRYGPAPRRERRRLPRRRPHRRRHQRRGPGGIGQRFGLAVFGYIRLDAPNPASEPAVRCSITEGDR